jgi:hypothetical protein
MTTINGVHEPAAKDASALRHLLSWALSLPLFLMAGCGGGTHPALGPTPQVDRVLVSGTATVDGTAFDAPFVGAVVLKDGLVTPCQQALTPVVHGRYSVTVLAQAKSNGCGSPGSQVVLWTYSHNHILFSTNVAVWPHKRHTVAFTPRYSTATPAGAAPVTAEFTGGVFGPDGRLPPGTLVEAYVGATRCGVASVRRTSDFFGYVLAVVGPDSIPGCTRDAPLELRVNGHPVTSVRAINTPPGQQASLDLTVR